MYYINRKADRRPLNFEIDFPIGHRFYHLTDSLIILTVTDFYNQKSGFNAKEKISIHSFFESKKDKYSICPCITLLSLRILSRKIIFHLII